MSFLTSSASLKALEMLTPEQKDAFAKRLIEELKKSGSDLSEAKKLFPKYFED